jgi:hypothetical protein
MIGDAGEDIGKPCLRIDAIELGGPNERAHQRRSFRAALRWTPHHSPTATMEIEWMMIVSPSRVPGESGGFFQRSTIGKDDLPLIGLIMI